MISRLVKSKQPKIISAPGRTVLIVLLAVALAVGAVVPPVNAQPVEMIQNGDLSTLGMSNAQNFPGGDWASAAGTNSTGTWYCREVVNNCRYHAANNGAYATNCCSNTLFQEFEITTTGDLIWSFGRYGSSTNVNVSAILYRWDGSAWVNVESIPQKTATGTDYPQRNTPINETGTYRLTMRMHCSNNCQVRSNISASFTADATPTPSPSPTPVPSGNFGFGLLCTGDSGQIGANVLLNGEFANQSGGVPQDWIINLPTGGLIGSAVGYSAAGAGDAQYWDDVAGSDDGDGINQDAYVPPVISGQDNDAVFAGIYVSGLFDAGESATINLSVNSSVVATLVLSADSPYSLLEGEYTGNAGGMNYRVEVSGSGSIWLDGAYMYPVNTADEILCIGPSAAPTPTPPPTLIVPTLPPVPTFGATPTLGSIFATPPNPLVTVVAQPTSCIGIEEST